MNRFGSMFIFSLIALVAAGCAEVATPETSRMSAQALEAAQIQAESAARQAEATADYYRLLRTATMEAVIAEATQTAWNATAQAQATAAERAWTLTAQAWQMTKAATHAEATATQVAIVRQATVDAANAAALATAQAAQAGIAQEALKQEQIRTIQQDYAKYAWATLPFGLFGLIFLLAIYGAWLYQRNRVLTQLADGKMVLIHDGKIILPDRSPMPVVDVHAPPKVDWQLRITENDQKVSAIRAFSAGGQRDKAIRLAQSMNSLALPAPKIEVVNEQSVRPMLENVLPKIYSSAAAEEK